ncbi:MAG: IS200/IS605 family transposase [Flavisolibacter sp.]
MKTLTLPFRAGLVMIMSIIGFSHEIQITALINLILGKQTIMSFVKVMIHVVWGTKSRKPILTKEIRHKLIDHISANARAKGIYVDRINGYTDHIHCLIGLNADTSISKTIQLLKGESAFWINKENLVPTRFQWADEYFAVSVSESMLGKVRAYIDGQEEHHRKKSFSEEYEDFMKTYKFTDQG